MILQASNTAYKVIGPNSLLIYTNTPEKRAKYADLYFKTFHLYNIKAERMGEILKSSMDLKTLVANNELNTLQMRGLPRSPGGDRTPDRRQRPGSGGSHA